MKITKMHGLGNDFILVLAEDIKGYDLPGLARVLCARRVNVGADGLIIVQSSSEADIRMRIFNSDGSEAEMCGNGIRCFARYVFDNGIVPKNEMTVSTLAGVMRPVLHFNGGQVSGVTVDMGSPEFQNEKIPVISDFPAISNRIEALGKEIEVSTILMGVPHTIVYVKDPEELDVRIFGPAIEAHSAFPQKTNVNFVQVLDRNTLRIETWERGAGLTLACGTGSCAAAVVSAVKGFIQKKVNVLTKTGKLVIEYKDTGKVLMTGPAEYVFTGEVLSPGIESAVRRQ